MSQPFDVSRMLIGAPLQAPMRVVSILFEESRRRCEEHGIREGSAITSCRVATSHVLLEVEGHGTVRLGLSLAVCIEVAPAVERAVEVVEPLQLARETAALQLPARPPRRRGVTHHPGRAMRPAHAP